MPAGLEMLPMAQTVWYIPTGLDIWNQKINKAPGHYTRGFQGVITEPPAPVVYWPDQEPLRSNAPVEERLGDWLTLVHRGQVIDAYRTFLGLMEDAVNRNRVLAELVFAGLIDIQDRMLYNRSYTTGHKSYRARATVELGNAVGWDHAHERALCRGARHGGRPALVFDLQDRLVRIDDRSRGATSRIALSNCKRTQIFRRRLARNGR